jgi:hypothetical protein
MGNMRSETSSINGINYGNWTYTADDELSTERYDADGNAWNSGGNYFAYDSDNELKSMNRGAVVPRQNPIQPGAAPDLTSRRRHQRRFQWREGLFGIRK